MGGQLLTLFILFLHRSVELWVTTFSCILDGGKQLDKSVQSFSSYPLPKAVILFASGN